MNAILAMKLHKASLKHELKGTKVEPVVGLDDKRFQYVPAIRTNLAETFRRALAECGERKREKATA